MPKITKSERKELKALIRQILILRDGPRCLRCGTTERLQASHIKSVGAYPKLEYDTDNIILLCVRCHIYWWHKEPIEANNWIQIAIPKARLDRIKLRAQTTGDGSRDYNTLKIILTHEIQQLQKQNQFDPING